MSRLEERQCPLCVDSMHVAGQSSVEGATRPTDGRPLVCADCVLAFPYRGINNSSLPGKSLDGATIDYHERRGPVSVS
jgi:hypothetical protein